MMKDELHHSDTGARPATEILRSLLALRANKDQMKGKDYRRQRDLLLAQAELTVETSDNTLQKAAPEGTITDRTSDAREYARPAISGPYTAREIEDSLQRYAAGTGGASPERPDCAVPFADALLAGAAAVIAIDRVRAAID